MKGEILLTPEQKAAIVIDAATTYAKTKDMDSTLMGMVDEACRAQVKRVVDEYQKVMQSVPFSPADIWGQSEEERAFWKELRKATGGEG